MSGGASHEMSHREARAGQALNAVATAGGLHAAYLTGKEIKRAVKGSHVPKAGPVVGRLAQAKGVGRVFRDPKKAALASLGGWGVLHGLELGSDVISARALHQQAQKTKPKEPVVAKSIGIAQSNGHGRRIRETDVAKALPTSVVRGAEKAGVMVVKKPRQTEGIAQLRRRYNASLENALNAKTGTVVTKRKGDRRSAERELGGFGVGLGAATALGTVGDNQLNRAFTGHSLPKKVLGRRLGGSAAAAGAGGALIAHSRRQAKVDKARRYDPEADRQRRLGAYAGLAGGGAIVAGERAGRELASTRVTGKGAAKGLVARHVGFKPGRTRTGLALSAATAGLAGIALGSAKRGVSERNQTWT